jgi:hypothetical protein
MAKLFASWIPGYSVVAQDMGNPPLNWNGQNYSDVNGYREGNGVTFHMQANRQNFFHAPLPTPVIVEDQRATLARVMILFSFPQGATLNVLQVYDGPNQVWEWPFQGGQQPITGDHSSGLDDDNTFTVSHDNVQWGVGISMLVTTYKEDADLYFAAAGGDFYHNI